MTHANAWHVRACVRAKHVRSLLPSPPRSAIIMTCIKVLLDYLLRVKGYFDRG